jgi:hypothetical protein
MRWPCSRSTIRSMMVAVAAVGLLIGASLEIIRLRKLSDVYAAHVITARRTLAFAAISAGWSDERWTTECLEIDRANRQWGWFQMARPLSPQRARERVAYWQPICAKYERAARYPWISLEPDPPRPE